MYELNIHFIDESEYCMVGVTEHHFNSTYSCLVIRQDGIETLIPQNNIKWVEAVFKND